MKDAKFGIMIASEMNFLIRHVIQTGYVLIQSYHRQVTICNSRSNFPILFNSSQWQLTSPGEVIEHFVVIVVGWNSRKTVVTDSVKLSHFKEKKKNV